MENAMKLKELLQHTQDMAKEILRYSPH